MNNITIHRRFAIIFVVLLFTQMNIYAQKKNITQSVYAKYKPSRSTLAFQIGVELPLGNFSSKTASNDKAGYAQLGGNFLSLSYSYDLNKHWGLSATLLPGSFPIKTDVLKDKYLNAVGAGNAPITMDRAYWSHTALMAGGHYIFPMKQSKNKYYYNFFGRAMAGIARISKPTLRIFNKDETNLLMTQKSASNIEFCYMLGLGIKMSHPRSRFSLAYSIDFMSTQANFKNVPLSFNNNGVISSTNINITQPIKAIMFNMQFGFRFR